jgi:hypothetical protein
MPLHLADSLLALAGSIDGDGGQEVCRTLDSLLRDAAPFDAGEVVLHEERGFHRFPFGGGDQPLAGCDLVRHVLARREPLRIDDPRDFEPFPETRDLLNQSGMRSVLALPLGIILHVPTMPHAASPTGVLIVGRRYGWAFVGASLNFLGPLAAMAGYALDRALALTALGHPKGGDGADPEAREVLRREGATMLAERQRLLGERDAQAAEIVELRRRLGAAETDLAEARSAGIAAQSALDQAVNRCHQLEARLQDATTEAPPAEPAAAGPPAPPEPGNEDSHSSRRARRRHRRGSFEPPSSTPTS